MILTECGAWRVVRGAFFLLAGAVVILLCCCELWGRGLVQRYSVMVRPSVCG